MMIRFEKMQETHLPEFIGGTGELLAKMHADDLGKILYGTLEPGSSIGMHTHDTSSEIIYILSGVATFLYDEETEQAVAGECHYCPKGHSHSMMNQGTEKLVFFAVVPEQ